MEKRHQMPLTPLTPLMPTKSQSHRKRKGRIIETATEVDAAVTPLNVNEVIPLGFVAVNANPNE